MKKTIRVLISGHVQGVWYRGWTIQQARALNLAGWVRNLSDGRVEAVLHGPTPALETMLAACRQGPPAAQVSTIYYENCREISDPGFHQRPTASALQLVDDNKDGLG